MIKKTIPMRSLSKKGKKSWKNILRSLRDGFAGRINKDRGKNDDDMVKMKELR